MSKEEIVLNKNVGFYFSVSMEFEDKQDPNNTVAAGNKVTTKYQLSGNTDTIPVARVMIEECKTYIKNLHRNGEK